MTLSPIYKNVSRWAIVYHTSAGSEEVEFVRLKFFNSEAKALKWFNKNYKTENFIEPTAVYVSGFQHLYIRD